jgi:hypothetical protein
MEKWLTGRSTKHEFVGTDGAVLEACVECSALTSSSESRMPFGDRSSSSFRCLVVELLGILGWTCIL